MHVCDKTTACIPLPAYSLDEEREGGTTVELVGSDQAVRKLAFCLLLCCTCKVRPRRIMSVSRGRNKVYVYVAPHQGRKYLQTSEEKQNI
jgi:hypothetical protein